MKKINFKKYFSVKNAIFISLLLVTIFLFGNPASASWEHGIIGGIIGLFISGITKILILLVNALIVVASYSDFIHAEAVTKGWVVVRDVCNMFFVVVLLVIAFATILGQEEYSAKKNLPKLIMAAVLINFSKMFCGLMIDVANVVMLTFVNAFKEIGSGNIIDMLGISDVLRYGQGGTAPSLSSTVSAYIFGLIYVLIAAVVVASMLAMLVMRVVMMWVYIVLSPAAFFLQAVPGKGQQYASQWWSKWTSNLIVGPVLAFFLWLSFAALQTGSNPITVTNEAQNQAETATYAVSETATSTESIDSKAGSVAGFTKFIIAIGMLLGGMKVAQEVGGETGAALGKGMGYINKGKTLAIGAATGAAAWAAKGAGRTARNTALLGTGRVANVFSPRDEVTGKRQGNKVGNLALQWREDLKGARKKTKDANREKFLKSIGIGEKSAEIGKPLFEGATLQNLGRGSKNAATGALIGSVAGPVGTLMGAVAGVGVGLLGKRRYNNAKTDLAGYSAADKAADTTEISGITNRNDKSTWTTAQADAVERMQKYDKNKKIVDNKEKNPAFGHTIGAMKSMTAKKKAAEDWVGVAARDPDYLKNVGKGGLYSSSGINDVWKRRLDELNKGGADSVSAISNMETEIAAMNPARPKDNTKLEEFAKLISAYEKGGASVNGATLGRIKAALSAQGHDPSTYTNRVLTNYKGVGGNKIEAGSGKLQYDAFAKNSAKMANERDSSKDIMGVSFAKLNDKLPANSKLDIAAGVNQKVEGAKLQELSKAMSSVIDDEIASLQTVGSEASKNSIAQLNLAKSRLASGDLSGLSLKNTDVKYEGATESERRRNEYNTVQHENMHQAGAQNEDLVDASSNILQNSKLVGRIPGAGGQRYDQEIGKLIAAMEKNNASPDAIGEAVASQIDKWQPASNAQRVLESEAGARDNVISEIAQPVEIKTEEIEKAIGKLSSSLDKSTMTSPSGKVIQLTPTDKDFFRNLFRKSNKINSTVVEKLKPLGAMAAAEEKKKNP
jgi:hypothetical protein